jgi:uncharacterized membrane-anchored protein
MWIGVTSPIGLRAGLARAASAVALVCSLTAAPALAQDEETEPADEQPTQTAEEFLASLSFSQGDVDLKDGLAKIALGDRYRYLGAEDTERVLVDAWGNPPGQSALGMIFPAGMGPLDDASWAVVVKYQEDGYVADDEAADMDYAALLDEMKEGARESNEARREAGFATVELVDWAEPPRYDAGNHKLYWAKRLAFEGNEEHTLNYDIRILGRRGVLVLSAVGGISQIDDIRTGMQDVLGIVEFNSGHRYTDFDATADQVATYGLGALIAGGVAAKTGMLAKLGVLLLAGKKVIGIGILAVGGLVARVFGRRKERSSGNSV